MSSSKVIIDRTSAPHLETQAEICKRLGISRHTATKLLAVNGIEIAGYSASDKREKLYDSRAISYAGKTKASQLSALRAEVAELRRVVERLVDVEVIVGEEPKP